LGQDDKTGGRYLFKGQYRWQGAFHRTRLEAERGPDRRWRSFHRTGQEEKIISQKDRTGQKADSSSQDRRGGRELNRTGQDRTGDMELFTAEDSRQRALQNTGQKAKSFTEQDRRQRAFHRAGQNRRQGDFAGKDRMQRAFQRTGQEAESISQDLTGGQDRRFFYRT
jgi:hypothetical protein